MSVTANLTYDTLTGDNGNDSIVIIKNLLSLPGGATLDTTNVLDGVEVIRAGHVIMQDDTTGDYEPLEIDETTETYVTDTTGLTYVGVLVASVTVSMPMASIMINGAVNEVASPYELTTAIKAGLPLIQFLTL